MPGYLISMRQFQDYLGLIMQCRIGITPLRDHPSMQLQTPGARIVQGKLLYLFAVTEAISQFTELVSFFSSQSSDSYQCEATHHLGAQM